MCIRYIFCGKPLFYLLGLLEHGLDLVRGAVQDDVDLTGLFDILQQRPAQQKGTGKAFTFISRTL